MANRTDSQRLLSIQSHVVSGYVGNRSATFPLQLLGWDVDVVNTVQFSNHTGYGRWGGLRFDEEHLDDLFQGLEKNGLLRYARVLTGYVPSPAAVSSIKRLITKLRALNPELIYLLDPVMGDMGRGMYVNPEVLPIYQSLLPQASIICPNQFEAQVLADQQITSLDTLLSVLRTLHLSRGVPHVIITSVELPASDLARIGARQSAKGEGPLMLLVGSSCEQAAIAQRSRSVASQKLAAPVEGDFTPWLIQFPEVEGYFSGVGDLFAALTLGRFSREQESDLDGAQSPIARAAELAIASLQGVLTLTTESMANNPVIPTQPSGDSEADEKEAKVEQSRRRELRIIQGRAKIESPEVAYRSARLPIP